MPHNSFNFIQETKYIFYFCQTVKFMACIRYYTMEKILRTNKNSLNLGVVWLQNCANTCMRKILETEHLYTNFKLKIPKIIKMHKFKWI